MRRATYSSTEIAASLPSPSARGANAVSIFGGSGSYPYLWSNTNDTFGTWTTRGTTSSFTPSVSGVTLATGRFSTAPYKVTVTDTVTHVVFASNIADYTWRNTSASCSA